MAEQAPPETDEPATPEPTAAAPAMPDNVVAALARVSAELGGIGKDGTADAKQGGYAYRGIEQITQAASPLLAKYGVVFVPKVTNWHPVTNITVNNKPWTDERIEVTYTVYGPGGADDWIHVGPIPSIGRDNSDKGANKCMTQAYKYALLQVLCVADAKDDGDQASHEADERDHAAEQRAAEQRVADENARKLQYENHADLANAVEAYKAAGMELNDEQRDAVKAWREADIDGEGLGAWPLPKPAMLIVLAKMRDLAGNAGGPTGDSGGDGEDTPVVGDAPAAPPAPDVADGDESVGSVSAPEPSAPAAPDTEGEGAPAPTADGSGAAPTGGTLDESSSGQRSRFAALMKEAVPFAFPAERLEDARHDLVQVLTQGRTRTSKEANKTEMDLAIKAAKLLRDGHIRFAWKQADGTEVEGDVEGAALTLLALDPGDGSDPEEAPGLLFLREVQAAWA